MIWGAAAIVVGLLVTGTTDHNTVDMDAMSKEVQQMLDSITADTGYGIAFGYVGNDGQEIALGSGNRQPTEVPLTNSSPSGTVTGQDTFQMGSGTKPFTATAVMQLVEAGKVKLDDPVHIHVDKPMTDMWNTTFAQLFGPTALRVTVDQLLRMNSGLNDFEGGNNQKTPNFDYPTLVNSTAHPTQVVSPLESFLFVGGRGFVCEPGTCFSYSTCGFMVAGMILLAHAPAANQTWETFDQFASLGLTRAEFTHLTMAPYGLSHGPEVGLTTVGDTVLQDKHGRPIPIWNQDQSIMSWTGGYAVSSALDIARFLSKLLVPGNMKYLSPQSIAIMNNVSSMNRDPSNGGYNYQYGLGLMHGHIPGDFDPHRYQEHPVGTFTGHDGMTYGFSSNNGYFAALNATLSFLVNQDKDFFFARNTVACPILEIIAKHKGLGKVELNCPPRVGHWTKAQGENCYGTRDGGKSFHGATDLEHPQSSSCGVMSLEDCQRKCVEYGPECTGITVHNAGGSGFESTPTKLQDQQYACFRKANVTLAKCDAGSSFDTYLRQAHGER